MKKKGVNQGEIIPTKFLEVFLANRQLFHSIINPEHLSWQIFFLAMYRILFQDYRLTGTVNLLLQQ